MKKKIFDSQGRLNHDLEFDAGLNVSTRMITYFGRTYVTQAYPRTSAVP